MSQRRMISKSIINSAKFLKMPAETQSLYFHLCLNADDDGVVEAFTVLRTTWSSEDNLRILHAKWLIHVLNEDFVSYILDRNEHNLLRADRKVNSLYQNLLLKVIPWVDLLQPKQRKDRKKNMWIWYSNLENGLDIQWSSGTSQGQPMDGVGKDSIGEDRLVKSSLDQKVNLTTNVSENQAEWIDSDYIVEEANLSPPISDAPPSNLESYVESRNSIDELYQKDNKWISHVVKWLPRVVKINQLLKDIRKTRWWEYSYEEIKIATNNYIDEIEWRKHWSDYATHRFTLYTFLKQWNGLSKFINM